MRKLVMEIKLELIAGLVCDIVRSNMKNIAIDADKIANTTAISALAEIQQCLKNDELSDFDVVENIVLIFEKYNIDFIPRHDF